jgi:hypothetical protein
MMKGPEFPINQSFYEPKDPISSEPLASQLNKETSAVSAYQSRMEQYAQDSLKELRVINGWIHLFGIFFWIGIIGSVLWVMS